MAGQSVGDLPAIVTRRDAKVRGLKQYFTGKPCPAGHTAERHTYNGGCVECGKAIARQWKAAHKEQCAESFKEWAKKNPDKIKAIEIRRLARKRQATTEKRAKSTRLLALIKERLCVSCKTIKPLSEFHCDRSTRLGVSNTCKLCALRISSDWVKTNPAKAKISRANYRVRKLGAPGEFDAGDIARIRLLQRDKCAVCAKRLNGRGHIDHIIPISRGGSNEPRNLQLTCVSCNCSKRDMDHIEFMRGRGRLL